MGEGVALVTGAGGSLGGALLPRLLGGEWEVHASLGPPGEVLRRPPPVEVNARYADVRDLEAMRALSQGVDVIIHVAGPASVASSFDDPGTYTSVHREGTRTVAQVAREVGARRLVYVSSAEVYAGGCCDEDAPLAPRSPYARAKLEAEALLQRDPPTPELAIVRPFLIADDLPPRGFLGWVLAQRSRDHLELEDPDLLRDLVWVHDVADLLFRATTQPLPNGFCVYNAGSGHSSVLGQVALQLSAALGGPQDLVRSPTRERPVEPLPELVAKVDRSATALGWHPTLVTEALVAHLAHIYGELS